jgi:transposase
VAAGGAAVYGYYQQWNATGVTIAVHHALHSQARQAAGRKAEPTAAVIDSQSVRAAPTVPKASGKLVPGRNRRLWTTDREESLAPVAGMTW